MTVKRVSTTATANYSGATSPSLREPKQWVRPADWPALPSVLESDEKFVGLCAVTDSIYNTVSVNFTTSAGTYTVDWGDGTVLSYSSATRADHTYDYATLASTVTTGGHKTSIVVVTPTTEGESLTQADFRQHGLPFTPITTPWLEIVIAGSFTTISFSSPGSAPWPRNLQRAAILRSGLTNMSGFFASASSLQQVTVNTSGSLSTCSNMFNGCSSLAAAPELNTSTATNFATMFADCVSLVDVPLYNTSSVTSMSNMFQGCSSLSEVPPFNTASVTNMNSMFVSCASLVSVPLFNTANVTSMSSMFSGCQLLTDVPLLNTANVTSMSSMFSGCSALTSIPVFNTAGVIDMNDMFGLCRSLVEVPLLNTGNVTNMGTMFRSCYSLRSVPSFNTGKATAMNGMFQNCSALSSVPLFNTANVTNMSSMFNGCVSLQSVPAFDTTKVTNISGIATNCYSLKSFSMSTAAAVSSAANIGTVGSGGILFSVSLPGIRYSFSVANQGLSSAKLNALYGNLATTTGQTITVTGNPGTSGDDPTIATAKGWTVTGS